MKYQNIKRKQKVIHQRPSIRQSINTNKDCLLIYEGRPYKAHYCTICGRVRDWDTCKEKCEYGYRLLPDELVFKRYKDLEQFVVDSLWGQQLKAPLSESDMEENL